MRGAEARTVAQRLVDSNLVGHDSHGVLRVGKYLEWVGMGWLKPNTDPTIVFDSPALVIVDGNRGFGQVIGEFATRLGIAKAAKSGIAMVGLRNCGHLGRLGDWAEMAAEQGRYRSISSTLPARSALRPLAAAIAGCRPIRWRLACRAKAGPPAILDITTSTVAEGKLMVASNKGEQVPAGWIVDKHGKPTTDPKDFYDGGALLTIGEHKGSGPVDTHRPPRRRDHDRTQFRSRRHGTAQQHAVDLHRTRGLRRHGGCAGRSRAVARMGEGVAAAGRRTAGARSRRRRTADACRAAGERRAAGRNDMEQPDCRRAVRGHRRGARQRIYRLKGC
jgi:hypothetical protein